MVKTERGGRLIRQNASNCRQTHTLYANWLASVMLSEFLVLHPSTICVYFIGLPGNLPRSARNCLDIPPRLLPLPTSPHRTRGERPSQPRRVSQPAHDSPDVVPASNGTHPPAQQQEHQHTTPTRPSRSNSTGSREFPLDLGLPQHTLPPRRRDGTSRNCCTTHTHTALHLRLLRLRAVRLSPSSCLASLAGRGLH